MGGRGASSGTTNTRFIHRMVVGINENPTIKNASTNAAQNGGWDDDGNPALVKFQGQEDDKTARFLAKVDRTTDYSQFNDGYGFRDNPYQKLVLQLGLNKPPTVVSDAQFNAIAKQTGAEVFYRGWSSESSADRFMQAQYTHTGTGLYGDGIYFANNISTAASYGIGRGQNAITKMMLSPNARVVDYNALVSSMPSGSSQLGKSLRYAGSGASRSYGRNSGESQWALKMGYNVIKVDAGFGEPYYVGLTRDVFIVSKKKL